MRTSLKHYYTHSDAINEEHICYKEKEIILRMFGTDRNYGHVP